MSSSSGAGSATAPSMSYCHECGIEIRPLMTPHPTCPRCNGGFVEEIDPDAAANEEDETMVHPLLGGNAFNDNGGEMDFMSLIQAIAQGYHGTGPARQASEENEDEGRGTTQAQADGSQPTMRSGSARLGPMNVAWGYGSTATRAGGSRQETVSSPPGLSEYLQRSFGAPHDDGMGGAGAAADGRYFNADNEGGSNQRAGRDGDEARHGHEEEDGLPPELASIRQLFTNLFGGLGNGPASLLADFLGGAGGGRSGDYVFGQQGLDDVISQLMEQTRGSTAPPPATKEAIAKLERFTRSDKDKVAQARNRECPTCMDEFEEEDAEKGKKSNEMAEGDQIVDDDPPEVVPEQEGQQDELVLMPCRHLFHQDCLVPWLETSATCPVCRVTLETVSPSSAASTSQQQQQQQQQTMSSGGPASLVEMGEGEGTDPSPASMRDRALRAAEQRQRQQGQERSESHTMPGSLEPDELD